MAWLADRSHHPGSQLVSILLAIVLGACSAPVNETGGEPADTSLTDPAAPSRVREDPAPPLDPNGDADGDGGAEDDGDDGDDGDERREPPENYLVWASGVEPAHLHHDQLPATITAEIRQGLLEGLFGVDSKVTHYPELLAGQPELNKDDRNQVTINYQLRDGLRWSDGQPLTSADVDYTYRILIEGCRTEADGSVLDGDSSGCVYESQSRLGYDRITSLTVVSETEFTVSMSGFYPGWRDLFSQVLAAHAYGESASEVNERLLTFVGPDGPLPTSGPLMMQSWERGRRMLLAVNPNYHGSVSPDRGEQNLTIDGVQLSFVSSPAAAREAVAEGRAHLTVTSMEPLTGDSRGSQVARTAWPGADYEHLGMNLLNTHLASAKVRRAVAVAIDKGAIIEQVYEPVIPGVLPAEGLGNSYWVTNQSHYQDHQRQVGRGDSAQARQLLTEDGYQADPTGTFTHPDRGPLRLRIATAANDAVRVAEEQLIVDQLRAAGFEVVADNRSGAEFVTDLVFSEAALDASASGGDRGDKDLWDLALFGWSPGSWPGGQSGAYRAGSRFNPYGFTSPIFDAKASECDAEPDDDKRAACYNELDSMVTTLDEEGNGLFVLPISQRPPVVLYNSNRLSAVAVLPSVIDGGPLINLADYILNTGGALDGTGG